MFRFVALFLALLASVPFSEAAPVRPAATLARAEPPLPEKLLEAGIPRSWVVPGELLVRFRQGADRSERRSLHAELGARVQDRIRGLGVDVVRVPGAAAVAEAVAAYQADPLVEVVEPNLRRVLTDARFPEQWAHQNTAQGHAVADPPPTSTAGLADADGDTVEAWATQDGDDAPATEPPVIAIVDSGVDVGHLDLVANLWQNTAETPSNDVDDDLNGYIDDQHGCDFTDNECDDPELLDPPSVRGYEHGTHVAGIAAAERGTLGTQVAGVCPACEIMVLKIGDERGLDLAAELRALEYARRHGADVVNMSFGGPLWSRLERDAIARLGQAGILAVAAAGNEALDNDLALANPWTGGLSPSFPASYTLSNIVSVAASNHRDQWGYFTGCGTATSAECFFTNWGRRSVDLAAPGVDIWSTIPGGADVYNGTSMAAPFVSGVAALVKASHPGYGATQLKAALLNSVDRPAGLDRLPLRRRLRSGTFSVSGDGRVNAHRALTASPVRGEEAHDGTIAGATRIRGERRGTVAWPGDANDVFRRRLRRGTYRVTLRAPRGVDLDLYVWKPRTTEIWQLEESCFPKRNTCRLKAQRTTESGDETIEAMRVSNAGVYYFHVSAYLLEAGQYKLRIRRVGSL